MINPTIDRSFDFPADVPEPGLATRAWRFSNVVWLAAYVYAGYKGTQLWTRFISDSNKAELLPASGSARCASPQPHRASARRLAHQGMPVHRDSRRRTARRMGLDAIGSARSRPAAAVCTYPRPDRARIASAAQGRLRRIRSCATGVGLARAGASGAPARRPSMRRQGAVPGNRRHRARRSPQHDGSAAMAGDARAGLRLSGPDARGAQVRPDGARLYSRGRELGHDAPELRR